LKQSILSVAGERDAVARLTQALHDVIRRFGIIFDKEHSHAREVS
jgi:hypothetical protein